MRIPTAILFDPENRLDGMVGFGHRHGSSLREEREEGLHYTSVAGRLFAVPVVQLGDLRR